MTQKRIHILALGFLILILFNLIYVSALTARIGNARMILRAEQGEEVHRYIKIKNTNSIDVLINLSTSGDLKDNVNLMEKSFVLKPNEEKKALFTIKSDKNGTFRTMINIGFSPANGSGHGVGLSSNIIMIVGDGVNNDEIDNNHNTSKNSSKKTNSKENFLNNKIINNKNFNLSNKKNFEIFNNIKKSNPLILGLITTTFLIFIFFILILIYYKKNNKNIIKIRSKKDIIKGKSKKSVKKGE